MTKAVPSSFQHPGDKVLLLDPCEELIEWEMFGLGSSAFASSIFGVTWGTPPPLDIEMEAALNRVLRKLAERGLISSAADISDGGIAATIAEACSSHDLGARIDVSHLHPSHTAVSLFSEPSSSVVLSCPPESYSALCAVLDEEGLLFPLDIGVVTAEPRIAFVEHGKSVIEASVPSLKGFYHHALEAQLAEEVLNA